MLVVGCLSGSPFLQRGFPLAPFSVVVAEMLVVGLMTWLLYLVGLGGVGGCRLVWGSDWCRWDFAHFLLLNLCSNGGVAFTCPVAGDLADLANCVLVFPVDDCLCL